jgi:hypothetical protein
LYFTVLRFIAAACRCLEEAILNFAGTTLVISHDRWFLDRVATHILAFEGDSKVTWRGGEGGGRGGLGRQQQGQPESVRDGMGVWRQEIWAAAGWLERGRVPRGVEDSRQEARTQGYSVLCVDHLTRELVVNTCAVLCFSSHVCVCVCCVCR